MKTTFAIVAALLLAGCTQDTATSLDELSAEADSLIDGSWHLEPGTEAYYCVRKTLDRDIDIVAFEALAPAGTQHTVLTVGDPSAPDGIGECDGMSMQGSLIYGSGVGSEPMELPEGIAVRVEAGQQLLLNLHLFNASNEAMEGTTAIMVRTAERGRATDFAEAVLMGPMDLDIPPGKHQVTARCTLREDAFLFAVTPHMHRLGAHMKVTALSSFSGVVTIYDNPYDFDQQQAQPLDQMVPMRAGDQVEVTCDYNNTSGNTVHWGESTNDEMCFAGVFRFPATDSPLAVCSF
jgi:hypothetical protein